MVEAGLALDRSLGIDTSYLERQEQALRQYLASNCVGIGGRLASLPGASQLCFDMLGTGGFISVSIQGNELGGTYFLQFGKREVDAFLTAARC